MNTTHHEVSTILAALRFWQRLGIGQDVEEQDIATDGGSIKPLDRVDVDELCERLNVDKSECLTARERGELQALRDFASGVLDVINTTNPEHHSFKDSLADSVADLVALESMGRWALRGEMTESLKTGTLKAAEEFIAGFEDDSSQEGVKELLTQLRAMIGRRDELHSAVELAMQAMDELANGRDFNEVVEATGVTARLSEVTKGKRDALHLFVVQVDTGDDIEGDKPAVYLSTGRGHDIETARAAAISAAMRIAPSIAAVSCSEHVGPVSYEVCRQAG